MTIKVLFYNYLTICVMSTPTVFRVFWYLRFKCSSLHNYNINHRIAFIMVHEQPTLHAGYPQLIANILVAGISYFMIKNFIINLVLPQQLQWSHKYGILEDRLQELGNNTGQDDQKITSVQTEKENAHDNWQSSFMSGYLNWQNQSITYTFHADLKQLVNPKPIIHSSISTVYTAGNTHFLSSCVSQREPHMLLCQLLFFQTFLSLSISV